MGQPLSVIDGWCIAVKANIAVKGMPHHAGIAAYKDDVADLHAGVVIRLAEAGAVILGIANMHEGALGATTDNSHFGRTYNPWRQGYTPGGSSGGSAAAVAAGLCDAALGSDTMGSVRIPSAYCGIQGFKPSKGAFPDDGILALSPSLDTVGVHARSVSALRALASVLSAKANERAVSLPDLKFGIWRGTGNVQLAPEVAEGFDRALDRIRSSVQGFIEVEPPGYEYGRSRRYGLLISEVEASAIHGQRLLADPEGFSAEFRRLMSWGASRPQADIDGAYAHIRTLQESAPSIFGACGYVLAPVTPETAFAFGAPVPAGQADYTAWANFAGLPAASIFTGLSPDGLPLALQIIGREGDDAGVLAVSESIEQIFGKPLEPALDQR
jgi:aspartyl-tRNA(Asn)/glutamyl-tRNA(Gln) amidotransferase subunit A